MTEDLTKFYEDLADLIKSFEKKNIGLKMSSDVDAGVVRIYGENSSALSRAKSALDEVSELAYDTAEHHPYWHLLYDSSQILRIVLEKWNDSLTEEEKREIAWYANKVKDSLANISSNDHHD